MLYVVHNGDAHPLTAAPLPPMDRYGLDWIVVEAVHGLDAIAQWLLYDGGAHYKQDEMKLMAATLRTMTEADARKFAGWQ